MRIFTGNSKGSSLQILLPPESSENINVFFLLMHYGPFSLLLTEQLCTYVTPGGHRYSILVVFIMKKAQVPEQYPPPQREGRNILAIF